ncbi:MAG TPA: hypothetical protein VIR81_02595 [Myxococcales bacterium]
MSLPLVVPELVEPVLEPTEPLAPELVPSEPALLEPVSVPEVVLFGSAGVVADELFEDELSGGEVRCIALVSLELRPWPCFLCFLWAFFAGVLLVASSLLPDEVEPLIAESSLFTPLDELSLPMPVLEELEPVDGLALEESSLLDELLSDGSVVFEVDVSELGVELLDGLLLGRLLLLLAVFDELPGSALLFWFEGSVAVPLSSVVWLFGVEVVLVSLVPLPVDVCARAPNAISASASAIPMIFIEPPWLCSDRSGDSGARIQPSRARAAEARRGRGSLAHLRGHHRRPKGAWCPHLLTPRTTSRSRRCAWRSGS